MAWPIGILSHVTGLFTQIPKKKMIICTFLWPKTLKTDLIWPIFGLFLDPSHVTDLSWPIVPFGLSTNSITPSHAMAYGRNGTVYIIGTSDQTVVRRVSAQRGLTTG
jgi:hypothetical protein